MLLWSLWMQSVLNCTRFRWASMQLQYLCSFRFDIDIKESLGRLPPDLYTLYGNLYDVLSKKPGDRGAMVFKNVLRWLLCAQRRLRTRDFLAVVSVVPSDKADSDPITKEDVLEVCNNFVVVDDQLDTFRFAHLSVREFLEQRLRILEAHRLMAELCLWSVTSEEKEEKAPTTDLLSQLRLRARPASTRSDMKRWTPSGILYRYAVIFWATHCKLAGDDRESPNGILRPLLRHMLSYKPSFDQWYDQLLESELHLCNWEIRKQLYDTTSILGACCIFNLKEQIEFVMGDQMPGGLGPSEHQQNLELAAKYGSFATIQQLLMTKHWINTEISNNVIKAAADHEINAKELITLLLSHPGGTTAISERVLIAAAGNEGSGQAVMPLLLRRLRRDISITSEGVKVAAGNSAYGYHVMRFLLDQLGADFKITTDMVATAQGNATYSNELLLLLLDRAGTHLTVTLEIVKRAAGTMYIQKKVMLRLLDQLEADTPITLDVVKTAAGNEYIKGEVMICLLDRLGSDIPITLDVVKTAAGNKGIKEEVMSCLLDRLEADSPITVEVLLTAADNWIDKKKIMLLLLHRLEAGASITAELAATIVRNHDADAIAVLLDQRGANVQITENVVRAAVDYNDEEGTQRKMAVLLRRLAQADTPITIASTALIVGHCPGELIAALLDHRGADVPITEEVVKAAVHSDAKVTQGKIAVLFKRLAQSDVPITVELTATIVRTLDEEVLASLMDQLGPIFPIVEEVVRAAVHGSRKKAERQMAVLRKRREREVFEVLARLRDVHGAGRVRESGSRLCLVECGDGGMIYLLKPKTGEDPSV